MKIANRKEVLFLGLIFLLGLYFRLFLRLGLDAHLLTSNADIWYRLSIAQYFSDYRRLPEFCLRYLAYGQVPEWYPPISVIVISLLGQLFSLDLPTVCSRVMPFLESLTPIPFFFLVRYLYNRSAACLAALILALTPSFIYWTGITTPQSLTLFLIPIYLLMLLWRSNKTNELLWKIKSKRALWILFFSILLAINFLTHLSYFFALIIILLFTVGLAIEKRLRLNVFFDFGAAVLLSQILTAWWWAPKNLYWWWVKALVTSSSSQFSSIQQLIDYGLLAGSLGMFAVLFFLFILIFRPQAQKPYLAPVLLWFGFIFLETQAEIILREIRRLDLAWSPLFKPLEGFRFFCFLAQPLSLLTAIVISEYEPVFRQGKKLGKIILYAVVALGLLWDIQFSYKLPQRWSRTGMDMADYRAALWFRANAQPSDRIIADYYRAQMFAGVTAGKALMGGLFPLRNVKLPYITKPARVQDDIYTIYATKDAQQARHLMQRYRATHIYYSPGLIAQGGFGSKYNKGFGVTINKDKFKNQIYFEEVYRDGEAVIIQLQEPSDSGPPEHLFEGDREF